MQLLFFSLLSPVICPSSTTVDPLPPKEQPNSQTRKTSNSPPVFPSATVLVNNSIPFPAVYPESEDEPLRSTNTSRQNVCSRASRIKHFNTRNHTKSVALHKQHRCEHFASRARVPKSLDSTVICLTNSNQSFFLGKFFIGIVLDKNLQKETILYHLNGLLCP